jgi:site-specific recombinase XerD
LDRYLKANDVSWQQLQQPAFLLHLRATISPHPNTTNRMLSHVRGLFDYLIRRQIVAANPLNDIPPVPERYFVPFVFSPAADRAVATSGVCKNQAQPNPFLV